MTTATPARTFISAEDAARAWGADHGVTGRTGGYLYAVDADAFAALPTGVRYGTREQRDRLALVKSAATASGRKAVQGWASLSDVLARSGKIETVQTAKGLRWAIVGDVAPAATDDDEPDDEPDREPSAEQERAWDAREDDARGHALDDTEHVAQAHEAAAMVEASGAFCTHADGDPLPTLRHSRDVTRCRAPAGHRVTHETETGYACDEHVEAARRLPYWTVTPLTLAPAAPLGRIVFEDGHSDVDEPGPLVRPATTYDPRFVSVAAVGQRARYDVQIDGRTVGRVARLQGGRRPVWAAYRLDGMRVGVDSDGAQRTRLGVAGVLLRHLARTGASA